MDRREWTNDVVHIVQHGDKLQTCGSKVASPCMLLTSKVKTQEATLQLQGYKYKDKLENSNIHH